MQVPTVLKPGTWTNRRQIILYRYMLQMLIEWLVLNYSVVGSLSRPSASPPLPQMYTLRY